MLTTLLVVWGVLTGILIVLLIYRGTLSNREDDQLFLDDAESHIQAEQTALMKKVNRLTPYVRAFGAASALLILFIAGLAVWQQIMATQ